MRLVISRVSHASVQVKGKIVGEIGKGLFVLVGVKKGDTEEMAHELAEKLAKLRVMADKEAKMNLSVKDVAGEILVVSQFTLYAETKGGNRPSFIQAAEPGVAKRIYEKFVTESLRRDKRGKPPFFYSGCRAWSCQENLRKICDGIERKRY